ncbi:hypothetical protein NDA18_005115 [Ustilago nuda]|nr:hypothetical protein NDA18_005115 [Ustilago nuda]
MSFTPISLRSAIELILLLISVNPAANLMICPIPRFLHYLHIISAFPRSAQLRPVTTTRRPPICRRKGEQYH